MHKSSNYYLNAFFWSTFQKVLAAVFNFLSVPLLIGYYGKGDYGILSIATACNGYMHLLDLGMNSGSTRFFSRWRTEGKNDLINRVARTNITFYSLIAVINTSALIGIAIWGENLFSVSHSQFLQLRTCLIILACFSLFSWITTVFHQLLVADKQMSFTMQMQSLVTVAKCILVICVFLFHISLTLYFFLLTALVACLLIPYALKCKKDNLIDSIKPANYWADFKVILYFSLALFALSLFQMTATQSRSIILSVFTTDGASTVADFSIISVIPHFIIMIGGTFSSIFLPKTAAMVVKNDHNEITSFAYHWTTRTTVIANLLCFPFIICSYEVLCAYVGKANATTAPWLALWCLTCLIQIHTTPANSLVLGYGKTKSLVITTAISCILSMLINAFLCKNLGVGSAIVGYFVYVIIVIGLYYVHFYKKLLHLNRMKMTMCFVKPTILGAFIALSIAFININVQQFDFLPERMAYISVCGIKALLWAIPYLSLIQLLHIVDFRSFKKK